jgi:hypothetical protein
MKHITLITLFALALVSCEKTVVEPEIETPAYEQEFGFGTRADGSGNPTHGDPYTIISYRVGGTSSTDVDKYQIRENNAYGKQWGYYAYDDGVISGNTEGTLVPVAMAFPGNNNTPYTTPPMYWPSGWSSGGALTKAPLQAQMLNSVPASGPNPATNQGVYRVAMISPAIPMRSALASGLGYLAVYGLGDDVYASMPDDADGNPSTTDPFEITVTNNRQVHELPAQVELFPIKSAVKVWFYSEYYADSDTEQTNPLTQTFTINTLRLYNVGSNGWYNARTGIVYPNYNYGTNWRSVHSLVEGGTSVSNYVNMASAVVTDGVTPGPGKSKKPIQYYVEQAVFPSDYRGPETGGLAKVKPLSMAVVLSIGSNVNNASVPIALKVERGKRYNFYVNLTSQMIDISYNVTPWDNGGSNSDDIGGDKLPYQQIPLNYGPGNWDNGGGGNDNIGN